MPYCFIFPLREALSERHGLVESLTADKIRQSWLKHFTQCQKNTAHFLTGLYFPQIFIAADLLDCVCRTLFPFYAFCFSHLVAVMAVVAVLAVGHSHCSPLVAFLLSVTSFHFLFDNMSLICHSNPLAFASCRLCLTATLFIYTSFVFFYAVTGVFCYIWKPSVIPPP